MHRDWPDRLAQVVEMMRELSLQADPQEMREKYARRVRGLETFDRYVSLSRRGLEPPWYRVTRDSQWPEVIDPWKERERLPLLRGGVLGEIAHGNEARLIVDGPLAADDPAAPYLAGYRTLIAVPHFDRGEALNWVLHLRKGADFDPAGLPELVWSSGMFGRMMQNLVLRREVEEARAALEAELELVARVQRSVLPADLPRTPGLELASGSWTARRAGGDYYAVYPLDGDRTGLLIADASGHSAPATVLMAMLHALALRSAGRGDPGAFLSELDGALTAACPREGGMFITALYAVFDPGSRTLRYARAGHPGARVLCAGGPVAALNDVGEPPLGLGLATRCLNGSRVLEPGQTLVMYTDGVTDAPGADGSRFGTARLDGAVAAAARGAPGAVLAAVRGALAGFRGGGPLEDDCTLLVARAR